MDDLVSALKRVDLPTLGSPTRPACIAMKVPYELNVFKNGGEYTQKRVYYPRRHTLVARCGALVQLDFGGNVKRTKLVRYLLFVAAALLTGDCVGIAATTKQKIGAGFGVGMGTLGAYYTYKLSKDRKNRKFSVLSRSKRLIEFMKTVGLLSSGAFVTYLALRERDAMHQPGAPGIRAIPVIQPVSGRPTNISQNVSTVQTAMTSDGVPPKAKEQTFEHLTPGFDLNSGYREKKEKVIFDFLAPVDARFESSESYGDFLALARGRIHGLDSRDYFAEPTLRQLQAVVEDKVNNCVPKNPGLDMLGKEVAKEFCKRYNNSSYPQLKKLSDQFKEAFALED